MKKYRRKRILAILMCISMILSITSYAMPVNLASDSNPINPENSIELYTEAESSIDVYTEVESSIEESTESSNEESTEAVTQESTEVVTQESTETTTQESEESDTEAESKVETETTTEAETSTEIVESETTTENDEASSESSSEVMESESIEQTESSSASAAGGSAGVESACKECGQTGSHAENCSQYSVVVEVKRCEECGAEAVDGVLEHKNGCSETCTCGSEDGVHEEGCPLYVKVRNAFSGAKAATVYIASDGTYTEIEKHGKSNPLSVEEYDGTTIYVTTSSNAQSIYFERVLNLGILGTYGANYEIDDTTYAKLSVDEDSLAAAGTYKNAVVTLSADISVGDQVVLTASHALWGEDIVTIEVIELPKAENIIDFPEEVETALENFSAIMEKIPSVEAVEAFEAAIDTYVEVCAPIPVDEPVPEEAIEAFETAFKTFAKEMGMDDIDMEITYPDSELEETLCDMFANAVNYYFTAMEAYSEDLDEAVSQDSRYSDDLAKMYALLEAKPDIYNNSVMTYGLENSRAVSDDINATNLVTDNITMYLFDYGSQINSSSEKLFNFFTSSRDMTDTGGSGGHTKPIMSLNMGSDGYPYVSGEQTSNQQHKASGSLAYLFRTTGNALVTTGASGSLTNYLNQFNTTTTNDSGSAYVSQRFKVGVPTADGTSTGLFQIDENGYYSYSSSDYAAYFDYATYLGNDGSESNPTRFNLYQYHEIPSGLSDTDVNLNYNTAANNGLQFNADGQPTDDSIAAMWAKVRAENFLPFNLGHMYGNSLSDTGNHENETIYKLKGEDRYSRTNMWFGMSMEFDFYMKENGKIVDKNGKEVDMKFEFFGDDDVFVYIDDVLVLDMGGDHFSAYGSINFADGQVVHPYTNKTGHPETSEAYQVTNLRQSFEDADADTSDFKTGSNTFKDFTKHTLKFYYLERGGMYSYCSLKFNMDPLPKGALTVEKQEANLNSEFVGTEIYEYELLKQDGNGLVAIPNAEFVVSGPSELSNPNTSVTVDGKTVYRTDDNGTFKLRGGQTATFSSGITVNDNIVVREKTSDSTNAKYTPSYKVTVANTVMQNASGAQTGAIAITNPDDKHDVVFTNTWSTVDLTVKKAIQGKVLPDSVYEVKVMVGDKTFELTFNGSGTQVIENIPVGYVCEISEEKPSNAEYSNPLFSLDDGVNNSEIAFGGTYEVTLNENKTVTITNRCLVDLKITKTGTGTVDENQTFVFNVYRGTDSSKTFYMTVTIKGYGSITLKNLPVDTYTVEEAEDWSWRYDATKYVPCEFEDSLTKDDLDAVVDSNQTVDLTTGNKQMVVVNSRNESKWMDGNSHCQNIFHVDISDGQTNISITKNPSDTSVVN